MHIIYIISIAVNASLNALIMILGGWPAHWSNISLSTRICLRFVYACQHLTFDVS